MLQIGITYNADEYPRIYLHDCPKDLPVEIIDNPDKGANARDVKIGNLTIVIFAKKEGE